MRRNTTKETSRPYTMPPEKLISLSNQLHLEKQQEGGEQDEMESSTGEMESDEVKERLKETELSEEKSDLEVRANRRGDGTVISLFN